MPPNLPRALRKGAVSSFICFQASRIATLHSLANIEQWAIDLSWDVIARFGDTRLNGKPLPRDFFCDFVKVAGDEAKVRFAE